MSEVLPGSTPRRRPVHLWIVGVLAVFWNAGGAVDYLMTQTGNEAWLAALPPEQLEYYYGFPLWATASWAIAVWSGLAGSLLLLFRRAVAEPALLLSLVAMLVNMLYTSISGGWALMGSPTEVAFSGAIVLIGIALWVYARTLRRAGVLL